MYNEVMRLLGRVAVVTGAGRGSGRSHCTRLAEEGADIIAIDLASAAQDLAVTAADVERLGRRCVTGSADVRDLAALTTSIDVGVAALGRLDVIVANAGIHAAGGPASELTQEEWRQTIDFNLTGVWHTVKAAVGHLPAEGGSVIIISSTSGLRGEPNSAHYSSSKHALVGLARSLANELGAKRIRVNTVHPGAVGTATFLNEATFARLRPDLANPTADDVAEVLAKRNLLPVGWVDPVDVSNAVLFLASDEARYVTGTQLVVDAGLTQKV